MPTRSWEWRGFSLQLSIPGTAARHAGRASDASGAEDGQAGRLIFRDPITPEAKYRDPEKAIAFKQVAEEAGEQQAVQRGWTGDDELSQLIRSVSWYHTIELPNGAVTPGQFDHRALLPHYGLPPDLSHKRALDVATFNGYWAFEMERRGANVTAVDLDDPTDWDYPTLARGFAPERATSAPIGRGFEIAANALGSKVQRLGRSVYSLDPQEMGTFDFVHAGDLLVHLRDPLTALERIRSVCTGEFLLSDGIDLQATCGTFGPTMQYLGGWDDVVWWVPSLDALLQLVIDAGFVGVRVNAIYNLAKTYERDGFWRASISATAT